jgi:hypothetical protein
MPWLSMHPEIQVVSRDRASAFADAVSQVLPHATQVADRYHLVQNLREHLQQFLDRKRTCLPFVEDTVLKSTQTSLTEKASPPSDLTLGAVADPAPDMLPSEQPEVRTCAEADLSSLTYAERKKKISRDKRVSRYEEVMAFHREDLGQRAIAGTPCSIMSPPLPSQNEQKVLPSALKGRASSIRICFICESNGTRGLTTVRSSLVRSKSVAIRVANQGFEKC